MCTASHSAAKKAIAAGYVDVSVMVDGIYGWKKAGQPRAALVSPPQSLAPKAVAALVKIEGVVIVDVREEEERHEVVPGARWMPMSRAAEKLSAQGFKTAYFEGPDQWKAAGLPVEKGPADESRP